MKKVLLFCWLALIAVLIQAQEVSISGNKFTVGGKQIWFNGINTPWQNWADFGGGFTSSWWEAEFQKYVDNKINLARIWIHCSGTNSPTTNTDGSVTGASTSFWDHMDQMVALSKEKKLYILPCLWSFDMVKNTNTSTYQRYRNLVSSEKNIQTYIDNFLIPLIKRYNSEPYILGWEICNEPEWMFENPENGPITKENVQRLHAMCAAAIHKNCSKPVTTGSSCVKWNSPKYEGTGDNAGNVWGNSALQAVYSDPQAFMDFWQVHWYPWMTQWFYSPYQQTTAYFQIDDKPVLVGESQGMDQCDSYICQTLTEMYENAYLNNFDGVCGWKTPQNDGYGTFENISVATNAFYSNHQGLVYPGGVTEVKVTGVDLNLASVQIGKSETVTLIPSIKPSDATDKSVKWKSSNTAVATISSTGLVMGVAAGNVTITVTTVDGGFTDSCAVTVKEGSSCTFGTPASASLPTLTGSYTHAYVIGSVGPNMSNVTNFTINWNLSLNGLWQLSFNTNNGVPSWWLDLRTKATWKFNQAQPEITFTGTGISGFDGAYWVAQDGSNFVMVSKSGGFAIYFSNSATAPVCNSSLKSGSISGQAMSETSVLSSDSDVLAYPNPTYDGSLKIKLSNAKPSDVTITVYNQVGQMVYKKMFGEYDAGTHEITLQTQISSGVYIIEVKTGDLIKHVKIEKR